MLTVKFIGSDYSDAPYAALKVERLENHSDFFMFDEDEPVAIFRIHISLEDEPVGVIDLVRFKDSVAEEDRIFFYHAMMFELREGCPIKLRMACEDKYLLKFGFEKVGENFEIYSRDINLYYNCGGRR